MNSVYKGEMRRILLVSLFIMVVPLTFFPKDFGLKLSWSLFLLYALELGWYMSIFFVMFSKTSALKVFLFAVVTLGYRIGLGIGFGMLLLIMFSQPLSSSLRLGIYQYIPAFLLQALMSPFVLKPLLVAFVRKTKRVEKTPTKFEKEVVESVPSSFIPERSREGLNLRESISSQKEIKVTREADLEGILHYLREYAGVKAAILVDQEGLVVAEDSLSDFDPEKVASFARCLKETNDQLLEKMGEKASERIGIYTSNLWICLNQVGNFTLVLVSDRHTDELLSVRILQSTEMIKRFLAERYQQNILKVVEG